MTKNTTPHGFSSLDLLVATTGTAILLFLLLPVFGSSSEGTRLAGCSNNLRLLGLALNADAIDHNQRFVWADVRTPGITGRSPNTWQNLILISNYLDSARVFACPADSRRPVTTFDEAPGGFAWPGEGQNNALSYFIGTDALYGRPNNILLGDRHIQTPRLAQGCSVIIGQFRVCKGLENSDAQLNILGWGDSLHGPAAGNMSVGDGSVRQTTKISLNKLVIASEGDGNLNNHILPPY